MSQGLKQPLLLLLAIAALGAAAFIFLRYGRSKGAGDGDIQQTALCAQCGHYAELPQSVLAQTMPEGRLPAMCPADGPAYKCPQCGQQTFYANPITCRQCGKKFLLSRNEQGVHLAKCPGCGWVR
jgi:DNA-directed RNA polymerase subunit RPC12/RpoP